MNQNLFDEIMGSAQEEASAPQTKKKQPRKWMIYIASAILICVIGLLVLIHSHVQPWVSPKQPFSISLSALIETPNLGKGWTSAMNYMGLPILVQTPNPKIYMDISVDGGGFYISTEHADIISGFDGKTFRGNQLTVPSNYAVYWQNHYQKEDGTMDVDRTEPPHYVRIILREEEHIVGYVVLRITMHPDHLFVYNFSTLAYLYFPTIDDQYQSITQEYVQKQIDAVIAGASEP